MNCPNLNESQKSIKKIQLESFDNYQKLSTLRSKLFLLRFFIYCIDINSRGRDGNPNQMLNSILANWIVPKTNTQDRKERTARILFKRKLYYTSLVTKKEMDTYIENEDNKVSYPSNHEEVWKIATMLHRKTKYIIIIFILYQIEPLIYKINKIIIKLNNSSPCRVEPAAIAENAQHDPHDNSRCWSSQ